MKNMLKQLMSIYKKFYIIIISINYNFIVFRDDRSIYE